MELSRLCILLLFISTHFLSPCDCRSVHKRRTMHRSKKLELLKYLDVIGEKVSRIDDSTSNTQPYVSSPFTLPPFDSLPPYSLPENAPPYCTYPPQPPSSGYISSPPPPPFYYLPPVLPSQSPPPGPTYTFPPSPPSPPYYYEPSPPSYVPSPIGLVPSPPVYVPSPTVFVPSPTVFEPPVIYPPPSVPPPPNSTPARALWCVAKPTVPDPIIQEAMNYACGTAADCDSILPKGPCFEPNIVWAHASYAFNSYWQRTKAGGGTCDFGGTAMLVTVDPSHNGCHFIYA